MLPSQWQLNIFLVSWFIMPSAGFSPSMLSTRENYDNKFVLNFTKKLQTRHKFDTLITFAAKKKAESKHEQPFEVASLERLLVQQLERPIVVWGVDRNGSLGRILSVRVLVVATIDSYSPEQLPILQVIHGSLRYRHNAHLLFIVKEPRRRAPTLDDLKGFFDWCWRYNFVNVALTFQRSKFLNQLFTYTPFPKITVSNVSNLGTDFEWAPLNIKNVYGYEFRTPVFQDPPSTYLMPNGEMRGITGSFITAFISQIGGVLKIEVLTNVSRNNYHLHMMLAASRGEIDIGVHPYSNININSNGTSGVLSFSLSKTCVMVPWNLDSNMSLFMRIDLWSAVLLILVIAIPFGWQIWNQEFIKGFYLALAVYYQQPIPSSNFESLPRVYKVLHLSILMGVFLLRNLKNADLSASISVRQLSPQIYTIDDLLQSRLPLMISQTQFDTYFKTGLLSERLKPCLRIVHYKTMIEHMENLNTSYVYLAASSYKKILDIKQSTLTQPLFRIAQGNQLCTPSYYVALPLQWNSPFHDSIFEFYLTTLSNGLQWKWQTRTSTYIFAIGAYKVIHAVEEAFQSLTLSDFYVLLKTIIIGYSVCILCLLSELVWKALDKKIKIKLKFLNK